jgi:hypothetical protein
MESSQNENMMIIDGENKIGLNEWNMQDEMKAFKQNKT